MKYFLRRTVKPKNKEELLARLFTFWASLTPDAIGRLIDGLPKVMRKVVEKDGRASGY